MSHSLILHQHRVIASKKLSGILRTSQRSDGVDLSRAVRWVSHHDPPEELGRSEETDRVSDDQNAVAQSLAVESWQGLNGTNGPLGSRCTDISPDVNEYTGGREGPPTKGTT